ncbi:hypothetical protein C8R43DRAFT_605902 [Mycena crocata]|nr:hypothetical protein C8R43DRAFT_605902 [Mycena crocata]
MSENTVPPRLDLSKLSVPQVDPARMLISPPPEEELQRTHVFGFPRTNTNTAQTKRKRAGVGGTPSKPVAEPVEATPNPKPRKTHRRRSESLVQEQDSPTRAAFARKSPNPRNPNADWVPPREITITRRSATPYEPPTDVFTPPREVVLQTPVQKPRAKPRRQSNAVRTTTPQVRALTPLRVVVHSVKKELPPIDLERPMTPPSPTDDPLLLVASSSPIKRNRDIRTKNTINYDQEDEQEIEPELDNHNNYTNTSSDAAYAPFDWTAGLPQHDDASSDSMDLDAPASFDGPLPGEGGWDSDDDDEGELPSSAGVCAAPNATFAPAPAAVPSAPAPSIPIAAESPPEHIRHTRTPSASASATGPYTTLVLPTKPDPPTPGTKARADAWGVWGSPFPGRGAEGEGSFRMDGRRAGASFAEFGAAAAAPVTSSNANETMSQDAAHAQEQDQDEEEEEMEEGVSILRALREEDEAQGRTGWGHREEDMQEEEQEQEHEQENEEDGDEEEEEEEVRAMSVDPADEQDQDEQEEEEEVRAMSIEPETAPPRFVIQPTPVRSNSVAWLNATASSIGQTQTPPMRRAPVIPPRSERTSFASSSQAMSGTTGARDEDVRMGNPADAQEEGEAETDDTNGGKESVEDPGPGVYTARGTRMPLAVASRVLDDVLANRPARSSPRPRQERGVHVQGESVEVGADADDSDPSDDDNALLGLVKITSTDPRAAARAAAILKQHDYDCFTRLQHKTERARRRHSYAGVSKVPLASPTPGSPPRGGKIQDILQLRERAAKEKEARKKADKEKKARRASARVVGERVYFPGSPAPVTTAQLLAEAEAEVISQGLSPSKGASGPAPKNIPVGQIDSISVFRAESVSAPAPRHSARRSSGLARQVPLPDSDDEEDGKETREWCKADWKALDACFTDERIAVAAQRGMVLNFSPAPAPLSTPVRRGSTSVDGAVVMASADAVDLAAVVARFVESMGGAATVSAYGPAWETERLTQRARALQNKQRAGHVAPPTPRQSTSASSAQDEDLFTGHKRRPSMEVPDFTPLGKRAMPPRKSRLPPPISSGAPFSNLPPTPEPARRRRVPGSLFAPRYSHLLDEAIAVSGGVPPPAPDPESEEEPSANEVDEQDTSFGEERDSSFGSSADGGDEEMAPATPLREREALLDRPMTSQPPAPATIGKRVKGFFFSYLPTLAKTAPPASTRTGIHTRPRLPIPPLDILEKPRGPITTPVRPPIPKARAPKELVNLQPAPPPPKKTLIPRRAPPRRLVDLHHVSPPPQEAPSGPRPRTSSGGSVKDLVKNFEALDGVRAKVAEVKRVRSVGDFGNKRPGAGAGAGRPMWRP